MIFEFSQIRGEPLASTGHSRDITRKKIFAINIRSAMAENIELFLCPPFPVIQFDDGARPVTHRKTKKERHLTGGREGLKGVGEEPNHSIERSLVL
jgi:hypothetical protein